MAIDLPKLEQLLAVARTGNFTRAAAALGITQPALSRNIGLLEDRFGFRLFDRGRGGACLTAVGEQVAEQARSLLRQATTLEHNLKLYGRGEGGQVRFGMGPQIGALLLPRLGAHMLATRPQLRMQVSLKLADMLLSELRDGHIEMLFCATNHISPSPDIAIEPLGVMTLGFIGRKGHPVAAKSSITMSDLEDYPLAIEAAHLPPAFPTTNGGLSCENSHILREVVLASDALWFSSLQMAAGDFAAGLLTAITVVDLPFDHVEVGMVRLARRESSPAAQAIAAHVKELLGDSDHRRLGASDPTARAYQAGDAFIRPASSLSGVIG